MQNNGDQSVVSGSALLSDPHIIVRYKYIHTSKNLAKNYVKLFSH